MQPLPTTPSPASQWCFVPSPQPPASPSPSPSQSPNFLVEIHHVTCTVPQNGAMCVKVWLQGPDGKRRGVEACTTRRQQAVRVVWNSCRNLFTNPQPSDLLNIHILGDDKDKLLASGSISIAQLLAEQQNSAGQPQEHTLKYHAAAPRALDAGKNMIRGMFGAMSSALGKKSPQRAPIINPGIGQDGSANGNSPNGVPVAPEYRVTVSLPPVPELGRKTVFFIRHGESRWNSADEVQELFSFDHPLNTDGLAQARKLNQTWRQIVASQSEPDAGQSQDSQSDAQQFLNADQVFSSPLTRALQTAMLAVYDHPTAKSKGITLLSALREIKHIAALDTIGVACGPAILERVQKMFAEGKLTSEEIKAVSSTPLIYNDTVSPWWSGASQRDSQEDAGDRFFDFFCTLMYTPCRTCIVIGHSIFFRQLIKKYAARSLHQSNPGLVDTLINKKLPNGACVRLDMDVSTCVPSIDGIRAVFGTRLPE